MLHDRKFHNCQKNVLILCSYYLRKLIIIALVEYSIDIKSLIGHISLTTNMADPAVKNCLGNNINKTEKL